jgi:hypothetical protein
MDTPTEIKLPAQLHSYLQIESTSHAMRGVHCEVCLSI